MTVKMDKLKELDGHWEEVMKSAELYGFITCAYGGAAVLMTHKNQLEAGGEEEYIRRQKNMFGNRMEDDAT